MSYILRTCVSYGKRAIKNMSKMRLSNFNQSDYHRMQKHTQLNVPQKFNISEHLHDALVPDKDTTNKCLLFMKYIKLYTLV